LHGHKILLYKKAIRQSSEGVILWIRNLLVLTFDIGIDICDYHVQLA